MHYLKVKLSELYGGGCINSIRPDASQASEGGINVQCVISWYDSFVNACKDIKAWQKGQNLVQVSEKILVKVDLFPMCILP